MKRFLSAVSAVALLAGCARSTATSGLALPAHGGVAARVVSSQAGEVELAGPQRVITLVELTTPFGWSSARVAPAATPAATPAAVPAAVPAAQLVQATRTASRPVAPARAATTIPDPDDAGTVLWRGSYEGGTYGQRGALAILLDATDRGVVAWRVTPPQSPAWGPAAARRDSVTLVRAPIVSSTREIGRLVLRLDSYFDPACNCTASATFRGTMRGDTLSGRFTVDGAATVVSEERGRWRVVRVATTP